MLLAAAERGRGGLRFVARDESAEFVPWPRVVARAAGAAAVLRERGVEPGERVALVLSTGPAFFDACCGALLAGAVPVPLYPPVRLGRLGEYRERTAALVRAAGARLVVTDRRLAALLAAAWAQGDGRPALVDAGELAGGGAVPAPPLQARPEDLALVQFSSGTTVEPKPVALSHRAVLAQVEMLNAHWRHLPEVAGVSWLPLYHDMGLIGCVFPAAEQGAELTLIPPELFAAWPALWLRTLSRYRGAVSAAPNFAYARCAEKVRDEELEGVDLSCWRVALNGAEAVSAAVMRRFAARFAPWGFAAHALSPVYGLAEATLAVTFSRLGEPFVSGRFDRGALAQGRAVPDPEGVELASVGRALSGCVLELRGESGERLEEGEVGRLWIRSPSLMSGYLDLPAATSEVLNDGWLDTGDVGFLWAGELYLTGRAKDLIVLRGRNYSPEDVERALAGLDGVRDGCVAGVSHLPEQGPREALLVFVETARDWRGEEPALVAAYRARLLERTDHLADAVVLLSPGSLPRTSSGKVRRGATLARHLAGTLGERAGRDA